MISPRYAAPVAVLLTLALIPTVIHSYRGSIVDDGLTTAAVPTVLQGMPSTPTERRPGWVRNNLESEDWFERVYDSGGVEVKIFAGRSYDPKRLYHHPELALLRGLETTPAGTVRLAERPEVPLHVVSVRNGAGTGVAVYALLYDGRFVENPITFQLRMSGELLFSGRKPMTLFMASALGGDTGRVGDAPATKVLLAAIDSFQTQPPQSSN